VILAIQKDDVKLFLEGVFLEGGQEVIPDLLGPVENDVVTKRDQGVLHFAFKYAHVFELMRGFTVAPLRCFIGPPRLSGGEHGEEKSQRNVAPRKRAAGTDEGEAEWSEVEARRALP
jgi:hypothetical protein